MQLLFITLILAASNHLSVGKDPPKCRFDRVHKLIAYNCANLKLSAIPRNLKASTEVRIALLIGF